MNQHPFTAALAEQHRADLMAAARDYRRAEQARRHRLRLRPRPTSQRITRPLAALRQLAGRRAWRPRQPAEL
jgi:hypothetical protein